MNNFIYFPFCRDQCNGNQKNTLKINWGYAWFSKFLQKNSNFWSIAFFLLVSRIVLVNIVILELAHCCFKVANFSETLEKFRLICNFLRTTFHQIFYIQWIYRLFMILAKNDYFWVTVIKLITCRKISRLPVKTYWRKTFKKYVLRNHYHALWANSKKTHQVYSYITLAFSKGFDCLPHSNFVAKLSPKFSISSILLTLTYLISTVIVRLLVIYKFMFRVPKRPEEA
jgi:hypothetical protein